MLSRVLFGGIAVVCLVLFILLIASKSTLGGDIVLALVVALVGIEAAAHLIP